MDSLLNQIGNINYQIVLVDDGSTDSTSTICESYYKENTEHHKVKVIHQNNGGLMNAWKRGVAEADGCYIVFCDADDYVDNNLIVQISKVIDQFKPDMIVYGIVTEYNNGEKVYYKNRLEAGYYDKKQIDEKVLPHIYFNGTMKSHLIASSRCSKAFSKALLQQIIPDLNDNVSAGEDDVTTFNSLLHAESIYYMEGYYPYHYVRNNVSMMGCYDPDVFDKIERCFNNQYEIAKKYGYLYTEQLDADYMSAYLLYVKKEICRNPSPNKELRERLQLLRDSKRFQYLVKNVSIRSYTLSTRIFAELFIRRNYELLIGITKLIDKRKGRNV
jgi:glycosyltransferase involved in cell wall biosynthesis